MTKAPRRSHNSTRFLIGFADSRPDLVVNTRDMKQVHAQRTSDVARSVYCRPPQELGASDDYVLVVLRPIYGLPEAGLYLFLSYSKFHIDDLGMRPTSLDPCLLYKREGIGCVRFVAYKLTIPHSFEMQVFLN